MWEIKNVKIVYGSKHIMKNLIDTIKNQKEVADKHIERKLVVRLIIFFVISLVLMGIAVFNVISGKIGVLHGSGGLILGLIVGFLAGRMFNIFWHPESERVVSRLDAMGVMILALYIIMEIERKWVFGHWIEGPALAAFSFVVLTGLILGRFLSMVLKIRKILIEEEILDR